MKTLLIDRDGVINRIIDSSEGLISPQNVGEFEFKEGAEKALRQASEAGFQIIVFTNQPDIGKSWRPLDENKLSDINDLLREKGVDAIYHCPHGPLGGREGSHYRENGEIVVCDCRKPQPGLLERADDEHDIDFDESYVIGDSQTDLEAASRFEKERGVSFRGKILIGEEEVGNPTFDNLYNAIEYIEGDLIG
ncbi:MAG: HAD-IIIA family hydrolase [Candidatus Nanohaloarchaea archaeon]